MKNFPKNRFLIFGYFLNLILQFRDFPIFNG